MKPIIFLIVACLIGLTTIAVLHEYDIKQLKRVTDEATPAVESAKEGYTFGNLLDAIEWVESGGQAGMMGDAEPVVLERRIGATAEINYRAIGAYQIHKIYVDDVNRILRLAGVKHLYDYSDRWDKIKSREMVHIFLCFYARYRKDKLILENSVLITSMCEYMARKHNGGPTGWKKESTKPYWEKVKAYMERPIQ